MRLQHQLFSDRLILTDKLVLWRVSHKAGLERNMTPCKAMVLVALVVVSAVGVFAAPKYKTPLASEDLKALVNLDAYILYNETDGTERRMDLDIDHVEVSKSTMRNYFASNITLHAKGVGEIIFVQLLSIVNFNETFMDHVWLRLDDQIGGYKVAVVRSRVRGYSGWHGVCETRNSLDLLGYEKVSGETPIEGPKIGELVIEYFEWELVGDAAMHKDLKYFKEPEYCKF